MKDLSEIELISHFNLFGRKEGRVASPAALRENFIHLVPSEFNVLEIGPFCKPAILGPNVSYFDVLDGPELELRARKIGYPIECVPEIRFVSPNGDLSIVGGEFDAVFSSHCIEHKPDLQQIERLLSPGGIYFIIIPDKRYCFDYPLTESDLADVLEAFYDKARGHNIKNVIRHRALTVHNDTMRHWSGDHADELSAMCQVNRVEDAVTEFLHSNGRYIDVHAWQFTPDSFRELLVSLHYMKMVNLFPLRVYDTPWGRNEFTAILSKTVATSPDLAP